MYSDIPALHLADSFHFPGPVRSTSQIEIINSTPSHMYDQRTKFILCSYDIPQSRFTNRRSSPLPLLVKYNWWWGQLSDVPAHDMMSAVA